MAPLLQVLVVWRYAPINPADLYSARLGGVYGADSVEPPYVAGHDGVGLVVRVRVYTALSDWPDFIGLSLLAFFFLLKSTWLLLLLVGTPGSLALATGALDSRASCCDTLVHLSACRWGRA